MSGYKIVNGVKLTEKKVEWSVNYGKGEDKWEVISAQNKVAVAEFWTELIKKVNALKLLKPILQEAKEESLGDTSGSQVDDGETESSIGSSFLRRSEATDDFTSGKEDPEEDISDDSLADEILQNASEQKNSTRRAFIDDSSDEN